MSDDEAPAVKPTKAPKAAKGKKKAEPAPAPETNGDEDEDESMLDFDVIEAKKETPKKEAPKAKAAKAKKGKKEPVAEVEVVEEAVEAPVVKATKAKKGKKAQEEPVEEAVEAAVEVDGDDEDAVEDDQTAALLAGFSSDDSDTDNDIDFPEDSAVVPKLTKSQKKAIARAKDTPKATEPGVIYVGYAAPSLSLTTILVLTTPQPRPPRLLRAADEEVLLAVRPRAQPALVAQQEDGRVQALRVRGIRVRRGGRHRRPHNEQLPHVRSYLEVLPHP